MKKRRKRGREGGEGERRKEKKGGKRERERGEGREKEGERGKERQACWCNLLT